MAGWVPRFMPVVSAPLEAMAGQIAPAKTGRDGARLDDVGDGASGERRFANLGQGRERLQRPVPSAGRRPAARPRLAARVGLGARHAPLEPDSLEHRAVGAAAASSQAVSARTGHNSVWPPSRGTLTESVCDTLVCGMVKHKPWSVFSSRSTRIDASSERRNSPAKPTRRRFPWRVQFCL